MLPFYHYIFYFKKRAKKKMELKFLRLVQWNYCNFISHIWPRVEFPCLSCSLFQWQEHNSFAPLAEDQTYAQPPPHSGAGRLVGACKLRSTQLQDVSARSNRRGIGLFAPNFKQFGSDGRGRCYAS